MYKKIRLGLDHPRALSGPSKFPGFVLLVPTTLEPFGALEETLSSLLEGHRAPEGVVRAMLLSHKVVRMGCSSSASGG